MTRILVIGRAGQLATALAEAELARRHRRRLRAAASRIDLARARGGPRSGRSPRARSRDQRRRLHRRRQGRERARARLRRQPRRAGGAGRGLPAIGAPLIHVSTDYVFDGSKRGAYGEEDPVDPASVYGASKEAGESAIRARLPAHVILRTAWVYAPMGQNFVRTMLRLGARAAGAARRRRPDGSPTAAAELARAVQACGRRLLAGGQRLRHLPFRRSRRARAGSASPRPSSSAPQGPRPRLIPIPTSGYPTPARRPANSVLDCAQVRPPLWRDGAALAREPGPLPDRRSQHGGARTA